MRIVAKHHALFALALWLAAGVALLCALLVAMALGVGRALPDGGALAFVSQGGQDTDIYIMTVSRGLTLNLTDNNARDDFSPTWSPNREEIAYVSYHEGYAQIYTMNANGTDQKRMSTDGTSDWDPAWSPDGALIAFISSRDRQAWGIYTMDANGRNPQRLATAFYAPTWSPDGCCIAVAIEHESTFAIFSISSNGGNLQWLAEDLYNNENPAWSPIGKQIAFASDRDGNWEIYLMNTFGFIEQRLTVNDVDDWDPAWSPDGRQLAFISDRDGNPEIYVMNADGSNQRWLTWSGTDSFFPARYP